MYFAKENSASNDVKKEHNIMEHRAVRLLSRRYDLTSTGCNLNKMLVSGDLNETGKDEHGGAVAQMVERSTGNRKVTNSPTPDAEYSSFTLSF
ncbi:hypothetical protein ALC57_15097 [Trachymyrmex cornetzi]|uniref:Uncharacterized protein n=1 Tax=Trachymyrmex cornetzi TaxID=471704 RepID=A0A151IXK4_9HYME|nr:hypothetical protein ALC57_15097 [Trachymyrmex cornetzi]